MFGGQTLLGGERNTKKIEGFALGNSPLEYTSEIVNGKTIVLYTTNGSKAIVKAKFSENLFICSFLNLETLANHLVHLNKDFEILCSGRNNYYSMEDSICAGRLAAEVQKLKEDVEISDSAKACLALNKSFGKNTLKMLKETEHGKILLDNGFSDDIKFCSRLNSFDVIPSFSGNALKVLRNSK
jgi:2-phosphosulfolactate phosphatase